MTKRKEHVSSYNLFDEAGGEPQNWGYTIFVIVIICVINIGILVGLRFLLDLRDEYDRPILEEYQQEIVLQFTGAFALSFGFGCCCCFCCGGKCPVWTGNGILGCFSCLRKSISKHPDHEKFQNDRRNSHTANKRRIRPFVINMNDHELTYHSDKSSGSSSGSSPSMNIKNRDAKTSTTNGEVPKSITTTKTDRPNVIQYFDAKKDTVDGRTFEKMMEKPMTRHMSCPNGPSSTINII